MSTAVPAADHLAIVQVLYQYCRGVDRMDAELTLDCFEPEAQLTYSDNYVGDAVGFVEWLWPMHAGLINHVHTIGNVVVAADGSDSASTDAQIRVTLRFEQGGQVVDLVGLGRYLDRWVRRDGRWRISARTYVTDMTTVIPVATPNVNEELRRSAEARRIAGTRDRADPSYALFDGVDPSSV